MTAPDVEAMVSQMSAPTADLADFLLEYEKDDNIWWAIACGHHQNLFEEAVEALTSASLRAERAEAASKRMYDKWMASFGAARRAEAALADLDKLLDQWAQTDATTTYMSIQEHIRKAVRRG